MPDWGRYLIHSLSGSYHSGRMAYIKPWFGPAIKCRSLSPRHAVFLWRTLQTAARKRQGDITRRPRPRAFKHPWTRSLVSRCISQAVLIRRLPVPSMEWPVPSMEWSRIRRASERIMLRPYLPQKGYSTDLMEPGSFIASGLCLS